MMLNRRKIAELRLKLVEDKIEDEQARSELFDMVYSDVGELLALANAALRIQEAWRRSANGGTAMRYMWMSGVITGTMCELDDLERTAEAAQDIMPICSRG